MERGRIVKWLIAEGEEIKPMQVFLHVETNELTEDGQPYLLEVESHESGLLRHILVPASASSSSSDTLPVGTPIGIFEDPDWLEGEPPRGPFLWQAYVKEGALRQGSCSPVREETEQQTPAATTTESKATKPTKKPAKARKAK